MVNAWPKVTQQGHAVQVLSQNGTSITYVGILNTGQDKAPHSLLVFLCFCLFSDSTGCCGEVQEASPLHFTLAYSPPHPMEGRH